MKPASASCSRRRTVCVCASRSSGPAGGTPTRRDQLVGASAGTRPGTAESADINQRTCQRRMANQADKTVAASISSAMTHPRKKSIATPPSCGVRAGNEYYARSGVWLQRRPGRRRQGWVTSTIVFGRTQCTRDSSRDGLKDPWTRHRLDHLIAYLGAATTMGFATRTTAAA